MINLQFLLIVAVSLAIPVTLFTMKIRKTSPGRLFQLWLTWIAIVYFSTSPYPINIIGFALLIIGPIFSYSMLSFPERAVFENSALNAFEDFPRWRILIEFIKNNAFTFRFAMKHEIMPGAEITTLVFANTTGIILEVNKQKYLGKSEFSVYFKTFFNDGGTVSTTNHLSNQDITFKEKHPQYLKQSSSYDELLRTHMSNIALHEKGRIILDKKEEVSLECFKGEYNDKVERALSEGYMIARKGRCKMTIKGMLRTLFNYYNFLPLFQKERII